MLSLLTRANIRTMCPALARAEAAVIDGGRFVFVGGAAGAARFLAGRAHQVIDAEGCDVLPGLNDSHLHFASIAMLARQVPLAGTRSPEAIIAALRAGLARGADGWLVGRGWNQERFDAPRLLTREDLDQVSPDVPVFAVRACGHIGTLNSAAMRAAGIDPQGDGILRENEMGLAWRHIPAPEIGTVIAAMETAQHRLFAQGITSVQSDDLGTIPDDSAGPFLRAMRGAGDSGRLRVRYALQANIGELGALRKFFAEGLHQLRGARLRVSCLKLITDGSLGARTAYLRAPYADAPDTRGVAVLEGETLRALVAEATAHNLPVAAHAIGDGAMQEVLDAVEREGHGLRNAVVHAQITDAEQIARCGRLGLSILAQPIFLDADAPIVRARVGDALADTSYCWRSMLGAGAHVAFGTDCPVEPFDTMPGLYSAITRHGPGGGAAYLPEEAFTLEEAIFAYTAAGAYATGEEGEKGRIQAGMAADFIVLDRALDAREPEALLETKVKGTYIDGERVWGD
ncbi:amidohydrolase [Clostridia bacterium]|nr:amidohydrolase [Clostridia bacterium]